MEDRTRDEATLRRRDFLIGIGATSAIAGAGVASDWTFFLSSASASERTSFKLRRATDQAIINITLLDMTINGGLVAPSGPNPGIAFNFGSQHTAEAALDGTAGTPTAPTTAIEHFSAESSRVVFDVPVAIPFTVAALFNIEDREVRLDQRAPNIGQSSPTSNPPLTNVTAIEIPSDLVISPNQFAKFSAESTPKTIGDVSEVWRMRLGRVSGGTWLEPPAVTPQGRAIYTNADSSPFNASPVGPTEYLPDGATRQALVAQYAATAEKFPIRRLWLSSAGGNFSTTTDEWTQKVVTGRDVFVEVVAEGYLLPFGIPMSIVEQAQRQFLDTETSFGTYTGQTGAMVYTKFLEIPAGEISIDSNELPFETIRFGPTDTRPISEEAFTGVDISKAFWILDGNTNLPYDYTVVGVDKSGFEHEITMPIAFVDPDTAENDPTLMSTIIDRYNDTNGQPTQVLRRQFEFAGSRIGWTPPRSTGSEEGVVSTDRIRFKLNSAPGSTGTPGFLPAVESAWIIDDKVNGAAGQSNGSRQVSIPTVWKNEGDSALNPTGAFLEYSSPQLIGGFTGDGGALGSPGIRVEGLSLSFGAGPSFGGVASSGDPLTWDPADALNVGSVNFGKILGVLDLKTLLAAIDIDAPVDIDGLDFPAIPRFSIETPTIPDEICHRFDWETTEFEDDAVPIFLTAMDAPGVTAVNTKLRISTRACITPLTGKATSETTVELRAFGLSVPAIELGFNSVTFQHTLGGEPTTKADFAGLGFKDDLNWLEPLVGFFGNLGDNFAIEPTTTSIDIDGRLPIPPINLGVVGIRDLVGSIGVTLPFDSDPAALKMSVGTKSDPFSVQILSAGGGGWLEVDMSADPSSPGITRISAGLVVSYSAGINVIVAKVSIKASIGGGIELENGEVTLLFFVSLEVEASIVGAKAYLSCTLYLEYKPVSQKLKGTVTVVAEFSILGGTVSKQFDIEQEFELGSGGQNVAFGGAAPRALGFAGGTSGTCFADQYPTQTTWDTYTEAFA